jgi:hypothetical protein
MSKKLKRFIPTEVCIEAEILTEIFLEAEKQNKSEIAWDKLRKVLLEPYAEKKK